MALRENYVGDLAIDIAAAKTADLARQQSYPAPPRTTAGLASRGCTAYGAEVWEAIRRPADDPGDIHGSAVARLARRASSGQPTGASVAAPLRNRMFTYPTYGEVFRF